MSNAASSFTIGFLLNSRASIDAYSEFNTRNTAIRNLSFEFVRGETCHNHKKIPLSCRIETFFVGGDLPRRWVITCKEKHDARG